MAGVKDGQSVAQGGGRLESAAIDGVSVVELHGRWREGHLDGTPLSPEWRDRLSRARRVEELADVLGSVV